MKATSKLTLPRFLYFIHSKESNNKKMLNLLFFHHRLFVIIIHFKVVSFVNLIVDKAQKAKKFLIFSKNWISLLNKSTKVCWKNWISATQTSPPCRFIFNDHAMKCTYLCFQSSIHSFYAVLLWMETLIGENFLQIFHIVY